MKTKENIIAWTSLPARDRKKRIVFWIVIFTIVWFIYLFGGLFWGLFSLLLLLVSTANFYTPTRYTLKEDHLEIKRPLYTQKKEYRTFRRVVVDKKGVFLSPFPKPSRLDAFRGVYLLFDGADNPDKIVDFLRKKVEESGA